MKQGEQTKSSLNVLAGPVEEGFSSQDMASGGGAENAKGQHRRRRHRRGRRRGRVHGEEHWPTAAPPKLLGDPEACQRLRDDDAAAAAAAAFWANGFQAPTVRVGRGGRQLGRRLSPRHSVVALHLVVPNPVAAAAAHRHRHDG